VDESRALPHLVKGGTTYRILSEREDAQSASLPPWGNEIPNGETPPLARKLVMKPSFPITVKFLDSDEIWILESEIEAAKTLEWFDTDDPEQHARVVDSQGRAVALTVRAHQIVRCQLQ
jgi:hypothetical protein